MHRVVVERMIGRKLTSKDVVHHIDGNKQNNDPSNLKVMTHSEHLSEHRDEMPSPTGEDHPHAKLTNDAVRLIRSCEWSSSKAKELASRYGVTVVTIRCVYLRKTWRHI